jgi:hypothetical protein
VLRTEDTVPRMIYRYLLIVIEGTCQIILSSGLNTWIEFKIQEFQNKLFNTDRGRRDLRKPIKRTF